MGYDLVTRAEIIRLLYIKDDRVVARHLNIAVSRVRNIRASHKGSRGRPRHDANTTAMQEAINPLSITAEDMRTKSSARTSSDDLLKAMLITGQHELKSADSFAAACAAVGLIANPTKSAA